MNQTGKINYVELPARNIAQSKAFFNQVFGWTFVDYGKDYSAFFNAGIKGGFFHSERQVNADNGSALIVLYSADLAACEIAVEQAGGTIKRAIFSFPGGRRFHFTDPSGNEFAVWSDM